MVARTRSSRPGLDRAAHDHVAVFPAPSSARCPAPSCPSSDQITLNSSDTVSPTKSVPHDYTLEARSDQRIRDYRPSNFGRVPLLRWFVDLRIKIPDLLQRSHHHRPHLIPI